MSNGNGGQVVTYKQKVETLRALVDRSKGQIAQALPRHMNADRFARIVMTSVQRTPQLLECTPTSLMAAVIQSAQLGLDPDGVLGHAYLIPFHNSKKNATEVQFIPGYKGLIDLSRRSGQVSTIYADVVYAGDQWEFCKGLDPKLTHVPSPSDDRGAVVAAYAVCHLRDGGKQFEWLWHSDIEKVRAKSKARNSGPWVDHWEEMAKKTVLRRLCKMLPVSVELQRAVALDELSEASKSQALDVEFLPGVAPEPESKQGLDALTERINGAPPSNPSREPGDEPDEPDRDLSGERGKIAACGNSIKQLQSLAESVAGDTEFEALISARIAEIEAQRKSGTTTT